MTWKRLISEAGAAGALVVVLDLATTLAGLSTGLAESNPLNYILGFQSFFLGGLAVQVAGSITMSFAWMKCSQNWRVGYLISAAPRLTASILNAQKILMMALMHAH